MDLVVNNDKKRKIIAKEEIEFSLTTSGLYLIEITARTQGEKQLGISDDEDLRIEIDSKKFPQLENSQRYLDSPASFSGGQLHGLKKTVFFILPLNLGKHLLSLIPDISAVLEGIKISYISSGQSIEKLELPGNIPAEDGDRRSWITIALTDVSLVSFSLTATLKRRFIDSDDIKVIIDGVVQRNYRNILHKLWYFIASLGGEEQSSSFTVNFLPGLHYIELWADRMPTLNSITIRVGNNTNNKLREYKDNKFNRDYNQLDDYIIKATDFWNNFFLNQMYPPIESLDPNLIKAIIYRESRLGYYPDKDIIDVMQVWDPSNPAKDAILGKTSANEFISSNKVGHISYGYPDGKTPPSVDSCEDSIFWGVRWLYHKSQYLLEDDKGVLETPYIRKWRSWKEAVRSYNGNPKIVEEYIKEVFSVYEKGVDLEGNIL